MKLSEILFEEVEGLKIVSLRGCEHDNFEIDLENGEVKDCTDISDELSSMFDASGVRIALNKTKLFTIVFEHSVVPHHFCFL